MSRFKQKQTGSVAARHSFVSPRRFIVRYLLFMSGMMLLLTDPFSRWLDLDGQFSGGVVQVSSILLNWAGMPCRFEGVMLHLQGISFAVKFGCNGLEAVLIFSAGVLAFPGSWRRRAAGLFAGFVLLQVLNWTRILLLVYTGLHLKAAFEIVHVYVAQGLMIFSALILFILYIRYAIQPDDPLAPNIHL
jgi:exosortase H (IPTLxxWG-CTERM-specific)